MGESPQFFNASKQYVLLSYSTLLASLFFTSCSLLEATMKPPIAVERADPVVSLGKVLGHVHTNIGGSGFAFSMDCATTKLRLIPHAQ
jgi:hypothetical protein